MSSVQSAAEGLSAGVATTLKFSAPSLVSTMKVPSWCSMPYSTPWARGSHDPGGLLGSVGRDDEHLRGDPGVHLHHHVGAVLGAARPRGGTVRRPSSTTRTSCSGWLPTRCRHSWKGRLAASGRVKKTVVSSLAQATPYDVASMASSKSLSALEVADLQGEVLVAGGVGGVGEPVVPGAHGQVGDVEIPMALGQHVLVQQHLLGRVSPRRTPTAAWRRRGRCLDR